MKVMTKIVMAVLGLSLLTGCADTWNKADARGGLFVSKKSDYIVLSQSGGQIMDVWKLQNTFVSSPESSDGWILRAENGDSVMIGGDAKVIRINGRNSKLWSLYQEYHMEFESQTYREKFNPVQ
jgi:hypothetical protein